MTVPMNGTSTIPPFITRGIEFADSTYELLSPITELRSCHDGTPAESRIIFTCRQTKPIAKAEEAVRKIKNPRRRPSTDQFPPPGAPAARYVSKFLVALRSTYALGIEPIDCGLRNVKWEGESGTCSIIDFELWRKTDEEVGDETKGLQRWGLARRPPSKDWWAEWNTHGDRGWREVMVRI